MSNIRISPFDEQYCEEYIEMEFDPDVKRYVGGLPKKSKEMMRSQIHAGEYQGIYAIIENSTGKFVGRCGFIEENEEKEIYVVIAREYWGKKYARPAIQELLKIASEKNIVAIIDPDNIKSLGLFRSMSFKEIGKVQSNDWQNNHIKLRLQESA